ncbi:hypothetical protein GPOL_c12650 [Gordonia polyisoprenivorans VH2]|uniref:Uncharacterized protein n=1 Tax=Gordonia polyisoprenivorans (strain DSM 44266 / VH2) TaxID=1112204 RepID=H6N3G1_GORPV|nr:hypothetical protein GPOL_c12650 [Gordonia polyisoprenivorans VH2]
MALRNSAFSRRNSRNSAPGSSAGDELAVETAGMSFSIQFRNVAGLMSSISPTCRRAASLAPPTSASRS